MKSVTLFVTRMEKYYNGSGFPMVRITATLGDIKLDRTMLVERR